MLDNTLLTIKRFIPGRIFGLLAPVYHWTLAWLAAYHYRFPSRKIKIIAVTGTKGKSTTTEILSAMLEKAGHRTALSNTIRYKIGDKSHRNLFKMSMPGRFFAQKMIRQAVEAGCDYVVMEMTSQGALLYRHRFIELDTLVFTNLSPEHIEAHGSYEKYRDSKLTIAKNMIRSRKPIRTIIVNTDDKEADKFLAEKAERKITYSIHDVEPYKINSDGLEFSLDGRLVRCRLPGLFNLYNILAAITAAKNEGVSNNEIIETIESLVSIPGRVEKITLPQSTDLKLSEVIVDYAHTPDSLEKLYRTFESRKLIGVLGGTGGGRDTWKRAKMGELADKYCTKIILTNEDPYDEDPRKIVEDVAKGIRNHKATIIMDRREAIRNALAEAGDGDLILITGKGTDPYIMGPRGSKIPWSDAQVVREELENLSKRKYPTTG